MKIAYFDCTSGASGEMVLGALISACPSSGTLLENIAKLNQGEGFEIKAREVNMNGYRATRVDVLTHESHLDDEFIYGCLLKSVERFLSRSNQPYSFQTKVTSIFQRFATVKSSLLGKSVEDICLNDVGNMGFIVEVCGTLLGLDELGVERVYASPLPFRLDFKDGVNGKIPLPDPTTIALLEGIPVQGTKSGIEQITPSVALLLSTLCANFGHFPAMRIAGQGYGAGGYGMENQNIIRLIFGEYPDPEDGISSAPRVLLETNIDNNSAEINGYVMEELFLAGALDVFFTSVLMKKNRSATLISVFCRMEEADALEKILFCETNTLGVRRQIIECRHLECTRETTDTPYGPVRVKVAINPDGTKKYSPEYEDCKRIAQVYKIPLKMVYKVVLTLVD